MISRRLRGGFSRWLLAPALCVTLAGCRTTTFVDGSEATALKVPSRAGELVIRTDEGKRVHVGRGSRLSFLLEDGSWTAPVEGRDLCVSEQAVAMCPEDGPPGPLARWDDVQGVEVDNFDGVKTFGAVVLVTALVAVVVVVVVLAANGGGGGLHVGGGGGGHLGGGGGHLGGGGSGGGHLAGAGGGHGIPGGLHASSGHAEAGSLARVGRTGQDLWRHGWNSEDDDRNKRTRVVPLPLLEETPPAAPVLPLFKRPRGQRG